MMKARTSLWANLAIAASVGLAGCGGSSNNTPNDPAPPKTHDPLPAGHGLTEGRDSTIKAGESLETPTGTVACPEDGMDCMIKVVKEINGSFTATSTGGEAAFTANPAPPPTKTVAEMQMEAYEAAKATIEAATTEAAAQAAYDDVDQTTITGEQAADLATALSTRIGEIQRLAKEENQKGALMSAHGLIDTSALTTPAQVQAAQNAIDALEALLDDPDSVDAVSSADRATYRGHVTTAQSAVDAATQRMTLADTAKTLDAALVALSGATATQSLIETANRALTALNNAISGADELTTSETAPYSDKASNAQRQITNAENAHANANAAQLKANAARLINGIKEPSDADNDNADTRFARYATSGEVTSDADVSTGDIRVSNGTNDVYLSEDKKTKVDDHYGWNGKRYTHSEPNEEAMYESHVYSTRGPAVEGKKFGGTDSATEYAYDLEQGQADDAAIRNGEINARTPDRDGTALEAGVHAAKVSFTSVDRTTGTEVFKRETDGPTRIVIPGSYDGVSGTYYCTPASGNQCSATVAASGFTLSTDMWAFDPANPENKVKGSQGALYASYGWWLYTPADDEDSYDASAFAIDEGGTISGIDSLEGKATYNGGAAGKYALSSDTGGTNDAGHFTARATLQANFSENDDADEAVTGTIDQFVGADGKSRNWKVELKASAISDVGAMGAATAGTIWTIGSTAADAGGEWTGQFTQKDATTGSVVHAPKVATGTFLSTFNNDGRMVGAFGVTTKDTTTSP